MDSLQEKSLPQQLSHLKRVSHRPKNMLLQPWARKTASSNHNRKLGKEMGWLNNYRGSQWRKWLWLHAFSVRV
jgi:hypothetical protein